MASVRSVLSRTGRAGERWERGSGMVEDTGKRRVGVTESAATTEADGGNGDLFFMLFWFFVFFSGRWRCDTGLYYVKGLQTVLLR